MAAHVPRLPARRAAGQGRRRPGRRPPPSTGRRGHLGARARRRPGVGTGLDGARGRSLDGGHRGGADGRAGRRIGRGRLPRGPRRSGGAGRGVRPGRRRRPVDPVAPPAGPPRLSLGAGAQRVVGARLGDHHVDRRRRREPLHGLRLQWRGRGHHRDRRPADAPRDPACVMSGACRRWASLGVLCLSLLVIVIDNTIVNVALPTLARDLDADLSQLQWVVDAYTLVFAGLLLVAGALGDRYGRRRVLLVGLAVFALGSAAAACSGAIGPLIAARGVMGAGAACIMPATLSLLVSVFTDLRERATAIGIWAATAGVGVALGPVAGGLLLDHFWWGSIFVVNVPLAALAIVGGSKLIAESRDPVVRRVDWFGAVLSVVGLVALVWAVIEAPSRGWTSVPVLGAGLLAAATL